jgi:high-affinity nickel permease
MDAITAGRPVLSRWQRVRNGLDPAEWRTVLGMGAVVLGLHVVGFVLLFAVVAPNHYTLGASGAFTVGVGFTAYTLGMRHAFDADHIAAIDNTTRKLMNEDKRPMSVGFFFSLGHSTIVFVLAFLFAIGIRALSGQVANEGSSLHNVTGWIGTGVSGTFLYVIAALNLVILAGIVRVLGGLKRGEYDEAELEDQLDNRGLMNRFYRRFTGAVTKPWQMYPIGLLFGLGFDTATEVALLFLAAGAAGAGLPFYPLPADPVRRGDVSARHHRWLVHELRLRLGLLETGAEDLLQPHDHRALGLRRPGDRLDRDLLSPGRKTRPQRRGLGLAGGDRPQHDRHRDRRPVRHHLVGGAGDLAFRQHRGALDGANQTGER